MYFSGLLTIMYHSLFLHHLSLNTQYLKLIYEKILPSSLAIVMLVIPFLAHQAQTIRQ